MATIHGGFTLLVMKGSPHKMAMLMMVQNTTAMPKPEYRHIFFCPNNSEEKNVTGMRHLLHQTAGEAVDNLKRLAMPCKIQVAALEVNNSCVL